MPGRGYGAISWPFRCCPLPLSGPYGPSLPSVQGLGNYRLSHPLYSSVLYLDPSAPEVGACESPAAAVEAVAAVEAAAAVATAPATSPTRPTVRQGKAEGTPYRCPGGPTLVLDQTPLGEHGWWLMVGG